MSDAVIKHSSAYRHRRFWNWFPLGLTYALLYMGRYNLTVSKNALGELMTKTEFGEIFGLGAIVYAFSFLVNGPLVDRIGGKKGILIGAMGAGIMNLLMGLYLYYVLGLEDPSSAPLTYVFMGLYAGNMYFQSYGAVSIVKVNSNWFHVRERGTFSGIFGVMISSGIFLAFDVTSRILETGLVVKQGFNGGDALWWAFFSPAFLLFLFFIIEFFLLRDRPAQAGHKDFDPGDASSGADMTAKISTVQLYKKILLNPVIITVAFIEFCTGILRNGVMHWFPIYAKESLNNVYTDLKMTGEQIAAAKENLPAVLDQMNLGQEQVSQIVSSYNSWDFTLSHWGLILWIAGCTGGLIAGVISDKIFGSRRAPSAGLFYGVLIFCSVGMIFSLSNGWILSFLAFVMSIAVIGTHGLLSGTATMDFGGRNGAATAVGVIDGFVYLGTGVQSISLGFLTTKSWSYWPIFLIPFRIISFLLLLRIWKAIPSGSKAAH